MSDPIFWRSLANAALYAAAVVPAGLALALLLSALIFPLPARAQTFYKAAFYLPGVVSVVVLSMVWLWLFDPTNKGLLNYLLASRDWVRCRGWAATGWRSTRWRGWRCWAGWAAAWWSTWPPWAGYRRSCMRRRCWTARAGGRSSRRITLPLLRPATLYLTVMGTIGSFQVFGSIYLMTKGGPNYATTTVVYRIYQVAFEFLKLGRACAAAMILAAIIVTISALQFRFIGREVEY